MAVGVGVPTTAAPARPDAARELPGTPAAIGAAPLGRIAAAPQAHARRSLVARIAIHAALIVGAAVSAFPYYWMLVTAFKTNVDASAAPPTFWPRTWHPE